MLAAASKALFVGTATTGLPNEPVDTALLRGIAAIERTTGVAEEAIRGAALAILASRDAALAAIVPVDPPPMEATVFREHLVRVITQLEAVRDAAAPRNAA
jgi:hypothetical protein